MLQIPAEFVTKANAIFDAFELEGHTKRVRDLATDLLKCMPEDSTVRKRVLKCELDTTDSPTPSVDISRVSESEYESVLEFRRTVKDFTIPGELRGSIRKTISEWIR